MHDEATLQMLMQATHLKERHKLQRRERYRVIPETSPDDRIDSAVLDNKRKREGGREKREGQIRKAREAEDI